MTLPTSYTEAKLAAYMIATVGDVADVLGWTAENGTLEEAIDNVLFAYGGVTDIEQATDMQKLRALARWQAWKAATASLVTRYDFSNPEGSYDRSQMLEGARLALADAEADAAVYTDVYAGQGVELVTLLRIDPYRPRSGSEW